MKKSVKPLIASLTLIAFIVTQVIVPVPFARAAVTGAPEVNLQRNFELNIPADLGTIESLVPGNGPTIIHIQTAHGNYEAQKKIQALLHYLKDYYGIKLLLLEGSAFKLNPEMLKFFPHYMDKTLEVNDELTKDALVKGPELFLLEDSQAQAYGVENAEDYRANLEAFRAVLAQKEKTEQFLQAMDMQIERLTSPYLGKELRALLKRLEAYELKQVPFEVWLEELKTSADKYLKTDLANSSFQIDWPMLVRVFKLKELEGKMDAGIYQKESPEFLKAIRGIPGDLYRRIESLLTSPLNHHRLLDPETGLLFEDMVRHLPRNFDYRAYPQVVYFMAHLILQSELKSELLIEEVDRLTDRVLESLAVGETEKKVLILLKDQRLLKKLFAMELTARDYEAIAGRRAELEPKRIIERFLELNGNGQNVSKDSRPASEALNSPKRVRDTEFSDVDAVSALFDKGLEFYKGAKGRDESMLRNIQARMKATGEQRAVVITGGFHTEPFRAFFGANQFNYALVTPKISNLEGKSEYLAMITGGRAFEPSTIEVVSPAGQSADLQKTVGTRATVEVLAAQLRRILPKSVLERGLEADFLSSLFATQYNLKIEKQRAPGGLVANVIPRDGNGQKDDLGGLLQSSGLGGNGLRFELKTGPAVVQVKRELATVGGARVMTAGSLTPQSRPESRQGDEASPEILRPKLAALQKLAEHYASILEGHSRDRSEKGLKSTEIQERLASIQGEIADVEGRLNPKLSEPSAPEGSAETAQKLLPVGLSPSGIEGRSEARNLTAQNLREVLLDAEGNLNVLQGSIQEPTRNFKVHYRFDSSAGFLSFDIFDRTLEFPPDFSDIFIEFNVPETKVPQADREVDALISALQAQFPRHQVLKEESWIASNRNMKYSRIYIRPPFKLSRIFKGSDFEGVSSVAQFLSEKHLVRVENGGVIVTAKLKTGRTVTTKPVTFDKTHGENSLSQVETLRVIFLPPPSEEVLTAKVRQWFFGEDRSEIRVGDHVPVLGPTAPYLEDQYKKLVDRHTPKYVKLNRLLAPGHTSQVELPRERFKVVLKREHLYPYDAAGNPEGLNLLAWLDDYEKEAKIATAGIRLTQNILYPWDTRNRISEVGVAFATLAKALVAREIYGDTDLVKFAGGESRYNTTHYIELIARIQAAQGIRTVVPAGLKSVPIWDGSFLIYKLDLLGGEHGTSSHANSSFMATKDLNYEGSQYLPEESKQFVAKIRAIFEEARAKGQYEFEVAAADDPFIDQGLMKRIQDGVGLYTQYLRDGVATDVNLDRIRQAQKPILVDTVGGSMYRTMPKIFKRLGIDGKFKWFHTQEDPFFHGIGKELQLDGQVKDYTQDTTIVIRDAKTGKVKSIPVMERMGYDKLLKKYGVGTTILMTDPDGDRLVTAQIEPMERAGFLEKIGVDYLKLDDKRIVALYSPNQSFFMTMVYQAEALKETKSDIRRPLTEEEKALNFTEPRKWWDHPRCMIMTTASSAAWREWAEKNGVRVINVPVGFKEIAAVMKKIEAKMKAAPDQPVVIRDVFGSKVDLGVQPRLLFAGEESGGMIMGPEKLIRSLKGREAIAMREKSAGEAMVIQAAMASYLESTDSFLSDYLERIFNGYDVNTKKVDPGKAIQAQFDVRHDQVYYEQNNPDPEALKRDKAEGEKKRTKNYLFYLSMALAYRDGQVTLEQVREILNDVFSKDSLTFSDLRNIYFVGDGVYFEFPGKVLEIRPSGTDAKSKAYAMGRDKLLLARYAIAIGSYSGDITAKHEQAVAKKYVEDGEKLAWDLYQAFYEEDLPKEKYQPLPWDQLYGNAVRSELRQGPTDIGTTRAELHDQWFSQVLQPAPAPKPAASESLLNSPVFWLGVTVGGYIAIRFFQKAIGALFRIAAAILLIGAVAFFGVYLPGRSSADLEKDKNALIEKFYGPTQPAPVQPVKRRPILEFLSKLFGESQPQQVQPTPQPFYGNNPSNPPAGQPYWPGYSDGSRREMRKMEKLQFVFRLTSKLLVSHPKKFKDWFFSPWMWSSVFAAYEKFFQLPENHRALIDPEHLIQAVSLMEEYGDFSVVFNPGNPSAFEVVADSSVPDRDMRINWLVQHAFLKITAPRSEMRARETQKRIETVQGQLQNIVEQITNLTAHGQLETPEAQRKLDGLKNRQRRLGGELKRLQARSELRSQPTIVQLQDQIERMTPSHLALRGMLGELKQVLAKGDLPKADEIASRLAVAMPDATTQGLARDVKVFRQTRSERRQSPTDFGTARALPLAAARAERRGVLSQDTGADFLNAALMSVVDYLQLEDLDNRLLKTGIVTEVRPRIGLPTRRLEALYKQYGPDQPIAKVSGGQSSARSFHIFLRKHPAGKGLNRLDIALPGTGYKLHIEPKRRVQDRPFTLELTSLREQLKLVTVLNRLTGEGNQHLFMQYMGGLDIRYFDLIRKVRELYKKSVGRGIDDQIMLGQKEEDKTKPDVTFETFIKNVEAALKEVPGTEKNTENVIQRLWEAASDYIDLNDLTVELINLANTRGNITLEEAKVLLFLQQLEIGVVSEEVVRDIQDQTQRLSFGEGEFSYNFQFNPGRSKRGGSFRTRKIGDADETLLSHPYVYDYLPLQRYVAVQGEDGVKYRDQANPYPHLVGSMNGILDTHAPQIPTVEDLERRLEALRRSVPEGDAPRYRDFFNAAFSGFTIAHLHYQEFFGESQVEKALAMPGALKPIATDKRGIQYSVVNGRFFDSRYHKSQFPLRTTVVVEGEDAQATAEAVIDVLTLANRDGSLVLNPESLFTYNVLLTDNGRKFRVFIFTKKLVKNPFNHESSYEPNVLVYTNEETLKSQTEQLKKQIDKVIRKGYATPTEKIGQIFETAKADPSLKGLEGKDYFNALKRLVEAGLGTGPLKEKDKDISFNEKETLDENIKALRKAVHTQLKAILAQLQKDYAALVAQGIKGGLILYEGRPATIEMVDSLIYGSPNHTEIFRKIREDQVLQSHIIEEVFRQVANPHFKDVLKVIKSFDASGTVSRSELRLLEQVIDFISKHSDPILFFSVLSAMGFLLIKTLMLNARVQRAERYGKMPEKVSEEKFQTILRQAEEKATSANKTSFVNVAHLAREYGLFDPNVYAHTFDIGDITYWAQLNLPEAELRIEFQTRQAIRRLALEQKYKVSLPSGTISSGALSWWAVQLREEIKTEGEIRAEFALLARTQQDLIEHIRDLRRRPGAITDAGIVHQRAEDDGLFIESAYSWSFSGYDVDWWADWGFTRDELKVQFDARMKIRGIAEDTHYRVADARNFVTPSALSYWADRLLSGEMTEQQIHDYFESGEPIPSSANAGVIVPHLLSALRAVVATDAVPSAATKRQEMLRDALTHLQIVRAETRAVMPPVSQFEEGKPMQTSVTVPPTEDATHWLNIEVARKTADETYTIRLTPFTLFKIQYPDESKVHPAAVAAFYDALEENTPQPISAAPDLIRTSVTDKAAAEKLLGALSSEAQRRIDSGEWKEPFGSGYGAFKQWAKKQFARSETREVGEEKMQQLKEQLGLLSQDLSTGLNAGTLQEILAKVKDGSLKLKGEDVRVIRVTEQGEEEIGDIDRNIAHEYGFLHRTSNAFIRTPEGKWLIQERAHNKKQEPRRLSITGGHVKAGQNYKQTIEQEIIQELGLPENWALQGTFEVFRKEGGFSSPASDRLNRERRSLYIYHATDEELKIVREKAEILRHKLQGLGEKGFGQWLEEQQAAHEGYGEAWAMNEYALDELLQLPPEKLTSDLLSPLLSDPENRDVVDVLKNFEPKRLRESVRKIMILGVGESVVAAKGGLRLLRDPEFLREAFPNLPEKYFTPVIAGNRTNLAEIFRTMPSDLIFVDAGYYGKNQAQIRTTLAGTPSQNAVMVIFESKSYSKQELQALIDQSLLPATPAVPGEKGQGVSRSELRGADVFRQIFQFAMDHTEVFAGVAGLCAGILVSLKIRESQIRLKRDQRGETETSKILREKSEALYPGKEIFWDNVPASVFREIRQALKRGEDFTVVLPLEIIPRSKVGDYADRVWRSLFGEASAFFELSTDYLATVHYPGELLTVSSQYQLAKELTLKIAQRLVEQGKPLSELSAILSQVDLVTKPVSWSVPRPPRAVEDSTTPYVTYVDDGYETVDRTFTYPNPATLLATFFGMRNLSAPGEQEIRSELRLPPFESSTARADLPFANRAELRSQMTVAQFLAEVARGNIVGGQHLTLNLKGRKRVLLEFDSLRSNDTVVQGADLEDPNYMDPQIRNIGVDEIVSVKVLSRSERRLTVREEAKGKIGHSEIRDEVRLTWTAWWKTLGKWGVMEKALMELPVKFRPILRSVVNGMVNKARNPAGKLFELTLLISEETNHFQYAKYSEIFPSYYSEEDKVNIIVRKLALNNLQIAKENMERQIAARSKAGVPSPLLASIEDALAAVDNDQFAKAGEAIGGILGKFDEIRVSGIEIRENLEAVQQLLNGCAEMHLTPSVFRSELRQGSADLGTARADLPFANRAELRDEIIPGYLRDTRFQKQLFAMGRLSDLEQKVFDYAVVDFGAHIDVEKGWEGRIAFAGFSYADMARHLGISKSQAERIYKQAVEKAKMVLYFSKRIDHKNPASEPLGKFWKKSQLTPALQEAFKILDLTTLGDLLALSPVDLLNVRGVGFKDIARLNHLLYLYGYGLKSFLDDPRFLKEFFELGDLREEQKKVLQARYPTQTGKSLRAIAREMGYRSVSPVNALLYQAENRAEQFLYQNYDHTEFGIRMSDGQVALAQGMLMYLAAAKKILSTTRGDVKTSGAPTPLMEAIESASRLVENRDFDGARKILSETLERLWEIRINGTGIKENLEKALALLPVRSELRQGPADLGAAADLPFANRAELRGNLVLARKEGEEIKIGDDITLTVTELVRVTDPATGEEVDAVKIGIDAPRDIPITRPDMKKQARTESLENKGGMLVLTRKKDGVINIGDEIVVTVVAVGPRNVRLGIDVPAGIPILRKELYDSQQAVFATFKTLRSNGLPAGLLKNLDSIEAQIKNRKLGEASHNLNQLIGQLETAGERLAAAKAAAAALRGALEILSRSEARVDEVREVSAVLDELKQTTNLIDWDNTLKELNAIEPEKVVQVTIAVKRGISMMLPMHRAVFGRDLEESAYRYIAGMAYSAGIEFGTDFVAVGSVDQPDLLDIGKIRRLLEGELGNIFEKFSASKRDYQLGIKNYGNAGKPVRVIALSEVSAEERQARQLATDMVVDSKFPGVYLGVDIGAGSMRFGLIEDGVYRSVSGELGKLETMATSPATGRQESGAEFVNRFADRVRAINETLKRKIEGIGIDMPGAADIPNNRMATLGQIAAKANWTQNDMDQVGQLIPETTKALGLPADRGLVRNDMDGVMGGVLKVLPASKPDFWARTQGNFRFDWMGSGHGHQFAVSGLPFPGPTEGGHLFVDFGKPGETIYDTESRTSIPHLIDLAIQKGFSPEVVKPVVKGKEILNVKAIGDAAVNESDPLHGQAVEVFKEFAFYYARNLIIGYLLAESTGGVVNAADVLLGGGITRGQTGDVIKRLTMEELTRLGYGDKIRIEVMSEDEVEKALEGIGVYDDLGPMGSAALIQARVQSEQSRSETRSNEGSTASLDEAGYQTVAATGSVREMKIYVLRVLDSVHLELNRGFVDDVYGTAESALEGFAIQFTKPVPGVNDPIQGAREQSLAKMQQDLWAQLGSWVIEEGGTGLPFDSAVAASARALAVSAALSGAQGETDYQTLAAMGDADAMEIYLLRVIEHFNMQLNPDPAIWDADREGWVEGFAPWYTAKVLTQAHPELGRGAQSLDRMVEELQDLAATGTVGISYVIYRSELRQGPSDLRSTVPWPAKYREGGAVFRALPVKLQKEQLSVEEKKEAQRRFLENVFVILHQQGMTINEIAKQLDMSTYTMTWWANGGQYQNKDGQRVWQNATLPWERAAQLVNLILRAKKAKMNDWEKVGRAMGLRSLTEQQIRGIFNLREAEGREVTAQVKVVKDVAKAKRAKSAAPETGSKHKWPEVYRDGRAKSVTLTNALYNGIPPATWWNAEKPGVLYPLWLDHNPGGYATRLETLRSIFRETFKKFYKRNEALTADERRIIQGRFLENLFVLLNERYGQNKHLTDVAKEVGISEYSVWWWANVGKFGDIEGNRKFEGSAIKWEYAVTLARGVVKGQGRLSDWKVLANILGDENLTESQIARIWNRSELRTDEEYRAATESRVRALVVKFQQRFNLTDEQLKMLLKGEHVSLYRDPETKNVIAPEKAEYHLITSEPVDRMWQRRGYESFNLEKLADEYNTQIAKVREMLGRRTVQEAEAKPVMMSGKATAEEEIAYMQAVGRGEVGYMESGGGRATRMKMPAEFDRLGIAGFTGKLMKALIAKGYQDTKATPTVKIDEELQGLIDRAANGVVEDLDDLSTIQRQLLSLRMKYEDLTARHPEAGVSLEEMLGKVKYTVTVNGSNIESVANQLKAIKFAGLNPENVYVILQPEVGGLLVTENGGLEWSDAKVWPEGHGQPFLAAAKYLKMSYRFNQEGELEELTDSAIVPLHRKQGVKVTLFAQNNDNYLMLDLALVERWSAVVKIMAANPRIGMVLEMVENLVREPQPNGELLPQKGGFGIAEILDSGEVTATLRDTIALKTPDLEPVSRPQMISRMLYGLLEEKWETLTEDALPEYLLVREGATKGQKVLAHEFYSGDTAGALGGAVMAQAGQDLHTIKIRDRMPQSLEIMERQNHSRPDFKEWALAFASRGELRLTPFESSTVQHVKPFALRSELRNAEFDEMLEAAKNEYASVIGIGSGNREKGYEQALQRMGGMAVLNQILDDPLVAADLEARRDIIRMAAFGKGETLQRFTVLSEAGKKNYLHDIKAYIGPNLVISENLYQKFIIRNEASFSLNVTPATVSAPPVMAIAKSLPPNYPNTPSAEELARFNALADQAYAAGKVGVLQVAGGTGARMGWPKPKGLYGLPLISKQALFIFYAAKLRTIQERYGKWLPWAVMTSEAGHNHQETTEFFERNISLEGNEPMFFGRIPIETVVFAKQRELPTIQENGEYVVRPVPPPVKPGEEPHSFMEGEFEVGGFGHGDSSDYILRDRDVMVVTRYVKDSAQPNGYRRIDEAMNVRKWMQDQGVEYPLFIQIDNVLAIPPRAALGAHIADYEKKLAQNYGQFPAGLEHYSPIIVPKFPDENVGMVANVEGRETVLEYNQVPPLLTYLTYTYAMTTPDGGSRYVLLQQNEQGEVAAINFQDWEKQLEKYVATLTEKVNGKDWIKKVQAFHKQNLAQLERRPDLAEIKVDQERVPRDRFVLWLRNGNLNMHFWTMSTLNRQADLPVVVDRGKSQIAVGANGEVVAAFRNKFEIMVFFAPRTGQVLETRRGEPDGGFAPIKAKDVDTGEWAASLVSYSNRALLKEAGWNLELGPVDEPLVLLANPGLPSVELDASVTGYDDVGYLKAHVGSGRLSEKSKLRLSGADMKIGRLTLAEASEFVLETERPYEAQVRIGKNVVVEEGVKIKINLLGNSRLEIEDNAVLTKNAEYTVQPGDVLKISAEPRSEVRNANPNGRQQNHLDERTVTRLESNVVQREPLSAVRWYEHYLKGIGLDVPGLLTPKIFKANQPAMTPELEISLRTSQILTANILRLRVLGEFLQLPEELSARALQLLDGFVGPLVPEAFAAKSEVARFVVADTRLRISDETLVRHLQEVLMKEKNADLAALARGRFVYRGYWAERLKDNTQALFNLLKSTAAVAGKINAQEPLVAVVAPKDDFMKTAEKNLLKKDRNLTAPERTQEARKLLEDLEAGRLIHFIEPTEQDPDGAKALADYVAKGEAGKYGVTVLDSDTSFTLGAINFTMAQEKVAEKDLGVLLPSLWFGGIVAVIVSDGVKKPDQQHASLAVALREDIYRGINFTFDGQRFIIDSLGNYIQHLFEASLVIAQAA